MRQREPVVTFAGFALARVAGWLMPGGPLPAGFTCSPWPDFESAALVIAAGSAHR